MRNPDHATVSDVRRMMESLESQGLGDYVVTCNYEYALAKKGDDPQINTHAQSVDYGGYDD